MATSNDDDDDKESSASSVGMAGGSYLAQASREVLEWEGAFLEAMERVKEEEEEGEFVNLYQTDRRSGGKRTNLTHIQ